MAQCIGLAGGAQPLGKPLGPRPGPPGPGAGLYADGGAARKSHNGDQQASVHGVFGNGGDKVAGDLHLGFSGGAVLLT